MCARHPKSSNTTLTADTSTLPLWMAIGASGGRGAERTPPEGHPRQAEPGGGAPEGDAPPLKSNTTHLTDTVGIIEFTRLNGREYEGRRREITWGRARKNKVVIKMSRGMSIHAERNRENVLKRAKTQIRRMSMHNKLNYMVTGTTRECIEDRAQFGAMVSEWERRVKHFIPNWETIVVLEKQKRGAYHFHAAVHGWQRLTLIRKLWWDIVGGQGEGTIHVHAPPGNSAGNSQWDIVRLARYLCKYLDKAIGEDHVFDKKTYWHTRGIDHPPVTSIMVQAGSEEYWARYLVQFIPGMKNHTWTDYNGAIGRTANF